MAQKNVRARARTQKPATRCDAAVAHPARVARVELDYSATFRRCRAFASTRGAVTRTTDFSLAASNTRRCSLFGATPRTRNALYAHRARARVRVRAGREKHDPPRFHAASRGLFSLLPYTRRFVGLRAPVAISLRARFHPARLLAQSKVLLRATPTTPVGYTRAPRVGAPSAARTRHK